MAAAQQPQRTRLHAKDSFYRQLLVLCLFLSLAMCLPPEDRRLLRGLERRPRPVPAPRRG